MTAAPAPCMSCCAGESSAHPSKFWRARSEDEENAENPRRVLSEAERAEPLSKFRPSCLVKNAIGLDFRLQEERDHECVQSQRFDEREADDHRREDLAGAVRVAAD